MPFTLTFSVDKPKTYNVNYSNKGYEHYVL